MCITMEENCEIPHQILEDTIDDTEDDYMEKAGNNRTPTDVPFFVFHGIVTFLLLFFICYCVVYGDIERLTFGYDQCGNVCGKMNDFQINEQKICKPEDMTMKPYLSITKYARTCVKKCGNDEIVTLEHYCIPKNKQAEEIEKDFEAYLAQIAKDLKVCWGEVVGLTFLAIGFSVCIYLLLRYMTAIFVWTIMIGIIIACLCASVAFWILTDTSKVFIVLAMIFTIGTLIITLLILIMRKRIEFVIRLLKEAGKSISAFPYITIEPILTFAVLLTIWMVFIFFFMWIESAGIAHEIVSGEIIFKKNPIIIFSRWYNLFGTLWMIQFVCGCQNMIIGGAVSAWYFTRNKAKLSSPVWKSACNMMKYHLGSISFGSLIITLIQMIKILLRFFSRLTRCMRVSCFCCISNYLQNYLSFLETFIKYLNRNAYIITSIHGYSFLKSGRRAFDLLINNAFNVLAVNSIGDFVLCLSKAFIIVGTLLVGVLIIENNEDVQHKEIPLILIAIIALMVAHSFVNVYEMAIDTIFICFCEDCDINDGVDRPYFMSRELMTFIDDSKSALVPQ